MSPPKCSRSIGVVGALLVALTTSVHAQAQSASTQASAPSLAEAIRHTANRLGIWGTVGLGRASAGLHCDACATESTRAYVLDGSIGVRFTPKLLMGVETFAWLDVFGGGVDRISRGTYLVTRLYPSTSHKVFLSGGVGVASFRIYDDEIGFATRSPSLSLGLGYDWRVGTVTLTPTISAVASTGAQLRSNRTNNAVAENARLSMLRTSIAFSWFR